MKTTKTLLLAALTALSLGTGTAMADGSDVINDYQAAKLLATRKAQPDRIEAGSSDLSGRGNWQLGPFHQGPTPSQATVGGDGSGG